MSAWTLASRSGRSTAIGEPRWVKVEARPGGVLRPLGICVLPRAGIRPPALPVDAVEIRCVLDATAPLAARHLRIRAERPRPVHNAASRVRRDDPVRSD